MTNETVTITTATYKALVDAQTRLEILRQRRITDVQTSDHNYVQTEDYVLGSDIVKMIREKEKAKDE